MTKTKIAQSQRIVELERKLKEALAGQAHTYHFADAGLDKASSKHLMASGVVVTLTALGGREIIPPTLIRNGLSDELIAALRSDLRASYAGSVELKPRGIA